MGEPAQDWLRSRITRSATRAVDAFLVEVAGHIATATSDAVSIRALSPDGERLVPVVAHHPDADRGRAMTEIMSATTSARDGLWRRVVEERRPVRWHLPTGTATADASADQAAFIGQYAIRAVLGVPLEHDGDLIGGLALIRFTVDRPFVDADEDLLAAAADDITTALLLRRQLAEPGHAHPESAALHRTRFERHRGPLSPDVIPSIGTGSPAAP